MVPILLPLALALAPNPDWVVDANDPRTLYDVEAYRLDVAVFPERKRIEGTAVVELRVVGDELRVVRLDLTDDLDVERVRLIDAELAPESSLDGRKLRFEHEDGVLDCRLPRAAAAGQIVRVAVEYGGKPRRFDHFTGFHFTTSEAGRPWIATSCQHVGAHTWWPCKASFFHPEDKPARVFVNLDVPTGLVGVANGRLVEREDRRKRTIWRWQHDYPLETYSVAINVGPYQKVEDTLRLPGIDEPVPFVYWVLPENLDKARLQFQEVPRLLEIFSERFGPFPFPRSKFALVETPYWGMEHSSAVAYGSSYPAWLKEHGGEDRYATRNAMFDYILVHETAHEWWGNAVSAETWGDFWIHEGFGTYAEGVYVEFTQDRAAADRWFATMKRRVGRRSRLHRGDVDSARKAYNVAIYDKGALVLDTLRHYVQDDDAWWRAVKAFNVEYRYGNANSADFRIVLERETGTDWTRFFDEWVFGAGYPQLTGTVSLEGDAIVVDVANQGSSKTEFRVPLDLRYETERGTETTRVWLAPGANETRVAVAGGARAVEVVGLHRVLGRHDVEVR